MNKIKKLLLIFILVLASVIGNLILAIETINSNTELYIKKMPQLKSNDKYVIVLHGLLSSSRAMKKIEDSLIKNGYSVINFDYSSRKYSIKEIAHKLDIILKKELPKNYKSLNFVTHSLGTIIVRYYLTHFKIKNPGRFVMIAPPNHGSIWAKKLLSSIPFMKSILGVAGKEVWQSPNSVLSRPLPCEFGIIAGGFGNDFGLNPFISGDNDFTLSISETKLKGMKDHIIIPGQHTTLLFQKRVINNIISFLGTGKFLY